MCGRYALTNPPEVVAAIFGLLDVPQWEPRYNIAPTQDVYAVRTGRDGGRKFVSLRWGLVPYWADDPSIGNRMINARSETVESKPAFRGALERYRCVIPATGFFEWKAVEEPGRKKPRKQPYFIHRVDGEPMCFAGLWSRWKGKGERTGEVLDSCTILTTTPNELVSELHDRMPVLLEQEDIGLWLGEGVAESVRSLLRSAADGVLDCYPVSPRVNKADVEEPGLLDRVDPEPEQSTLF